jgi:hypothetical protein
MQMSAALQMQQRSPLLLLLLLLLLIQWCLLLLSHLQACRQSALGLLQRQQRQALQALLLPV